MTTYREAIYMCLDLLKGMGDDFTYTEDHIAYLLDKFRALLLKQRYGNDPKKHVPYSNYQTIIINITDLSVDYNEQYKSDNQIPYLLQIGIPRVSFKDYYDINFEFVSRERFPFVGNNKYLKRTWYGCINEDNHFCLKTSSVRYIVTDGEPLQIKMTAIFENPRDITDEISFGETPNGDWLDRNIPIEEGLITTLIELVVKELTGSMYIPSDDINNNKDDKADLAGFVSRNMKSNVAKQLDR